MESPLEPAVIAANTREPTIWEKKNKNLNDHAEEIEGSNRRTKQLQSRIMHFQQRRADKIDIHTNSMTRTDLKTQIHLP